MDEQNEASSGRNQAASEGKIDPIENPLLPLDHNRDGLSDRIEALPQTDLESADTNKDGVNHLEEMVSDPDPKIPEPNRDSIVQLDKLARSIQANLVDQSEESLQSIEGRQSLTQNPSLPSFDAKLEPGSSGLVQLPDLKPDILSKNTSKTEQPAIDKFYQRLQERTNLDIDNVTVSIYQGPKQLYCGTSQTVELNILTQEQQDLLQKSLDDPTGLKGELLITLNEQTIFHLIDGELKIDSLGLAGKQELASLQPPKQVQAASSPPIFNAPAAYNRYQQQSQAESTVPATPASIDAYERIAQKALNDRQPREQVKQVLKSHPFHQTLAQCLGEEDASRFTGHLLNSLADQAKTNSLSSIANTDNPVAALESRVKNLESFNQHLSSQVEILSQKLEKLGHIKSGRMTII